MDICPEMVKYIPAGNSKREYSGRVEIVILY